MKILLINSLFPPDIRGGAERSVDELRRNLEMQGHSVTVVALAIRSHYLDTNVVRIKTRKMNPWSNDLELGRCSKMIWHFTDRTGLFRSNQIKKILRQVQPDVIHTNNLAGIGVIIWKVASKLSIPIVHTARDYYLTCIRSSSFKNEKNCVKQCLSCNLFTSKRRTYSNKYSPHLVGISRFILEHHSNLGYFRNSLQNIIQNSPQIENSSSSQRALPIQGHEIFGYIGQLSPEKGIDQLIEAFKESGSKNAALLILGEGNRAYSNLLRQKSQLYSNIIFLGEFDKTLVMPYIDFILIPSVWNEPLGRVLTESALFGIPVAYTPVGGLAEAVMEIEGTFYQLEDATINSWKNFFIQIDNGDMSGFSRRKFGDEKKKILATDMYLQVYKSEVEGVNSYKLELQRGREI
jgi:glycosyltransferase involved in cell wall biosynthesis